MKLPYINVERIIIIIVSILALIGWTRTFHPTSTNLTNVADDIAGENPNLAIVLYTAADALEEGYIHPLAVISTTFQERYILDSIEMNKKKNSDINI